MCTACRSPDILVVFKLGQADGALLCVILRVISAPFHLQQAVQLLLVVMIFQHQHSNLVEACLKVVGLIPDGITGILN